MIGAMIALAAALLYSLGGVMQHRAISTDAHDAFDTAGLRRGIAQPLWFAGLAVMAAAVAIQLVALAMAPLVTVQTIMTTMVLWILVFAALLEGARLGAREYLGSVVVAVGVIGFVVSTSPQGPEHSAGAVEWALASVVAVLAAAALLTLARFLPSGPAAAALGSGAGILNVLGSGLASAALVLVSVGGLGGMLASWLPYGAAVVLVASIWVTAMAFAAGPVTASIPPMIAANPVIGLILGTWLLGQSWAMGAGTLTLAGVALVIMITGIAILARSSVVAGQLQQRPVAGQEVG